MSEHVIQNQIRNALAGECILFRANVGTGWQGQGKPFRVLRTQSVIVQPGDVVLRQARPFSTGLPEGFSDTFGVVQVTITADMVGQVLGVALFGEVKDEDGRVKPKQSAFLRAMTNYGALAGVWRSVADALRMVRGAKGK
ncbi:MULTISPECIES: hypothetical protein [Enterobacteriaceae]|uniref:hypothetical protein n=1 Tax=Enterobacteriaceae TaxID=543 RepID=UPI001FF2D983|nr:MULTISPECIES: hypothetical protein [Enterobacteriaceae]MDT9046454.1 hypothetical protein [Escherichia coli]UOV84399.1 hypothetical protein MU320_29070 [Klebsiella pneumoniae]